MLISITLVLAASLAQDPALLGTAPAPEPSPAPIDVATLAREFGERRSPTQFPTPAFATRFELSPAQADAPRIERDGHTELVLFELDGPGALVRLDTTGDWSSGIIRVYLDGADEPLLEQPLADILIADLGLPVAMHGSSLGGFSVLACVPFAKACRVTLESGGDPLPEFTVQWRRYAEDASVASLTAEELTHEHPEIARAAVGRRSFEFRHGAQAYRFGKIISYSGTGGTSRWNAMSIASGDSGPHVVSELRIGPLTADSPELLEQLMRRTLLSITFDGIETVHVPLGDFFASAPGVNPHGSSDFPFATVSPLEVTPEGVLICRWPMPYRKTCLIKIEAQMDVPFAVPGLVTVEPREWTEDSLYFHSAWRYEPYLESPPSRSWEVLRVAGRGLLVGESLTVGSRDSSWRGGRARIVADSHGHRSRGILEGLVLPVHVRQEPYKEREESVWPLFPPLSCAPRNAFEGGDGWTSILRLRTLDAVVFSNELRYEVEVDFPGTPLRSYAATTWFYADADARVDRGPVAELSSLGITAPE